MNRAVFLDRDGVINAALWNPLEGRWDSPYALQDLRLLPGVAQAVATIKRLGFLTVVVSNQPGVAKGKCSPNLLDALTEGMLQGLAREGAGLDRIYYCLHHPKAKVEALRGDCPCRKPKPGLLLQAAQELDIDLGHSYMVGDSPADVEAGLAAGCQTVLLRKAWPRDRTAASSPHLVATSLAAAVEYISVGGEAWRSS